MSDGNETTHVILPVDEYERLLMADAAVEAQAITANSNAEWHDWEDVKLDWAGQRLAQARKEQGLSQKELGEKLGIAQTQISRIERHPDRTTLKTLRKIASALKVDVRNLIG